MSKETRCYVLINLQVVGDILLQFHQIYPFNKREDTQVQPRSSEREINVAEKRPTTQ